MCCTVCVCEGARKRRGERQRECFVSVCPKRMRCWLVKRRGVHTGGWSLARLVLGIIYFFSMPAERKKFRAPTTGQPTDHITPPHAEQACTYLARELRQSPGGLPKNLGIHTGPLVTLLSAAMEIECQVVTLLAQCMQLLRKLANLLGQRRHEVKRLIRPILGLPEPLLLPLGGLASPRHCLKSHARVCLDPPLVVPRVASSLLGLPLSSVPAGRKASLAYEFSSVPAGRPNLELLGCASGFTRKARARSPDAKNNHIKKFGSAWSYSVSSPRVFTVSERLSTCLAQREKYRSTNKR